MTQANSWPTTRVTLLARIQDARDADGWRAFVDLYAPIIYHYCRKWGLQDSDAEDVAQEVFWRVSRAIAKFEYDPNRGQFRGWLGLITHQQMLRRREKISGVGRGIGAGAGDDLCRGLSGEVDAEWVEAFNAHIYRTAVLRIRGEFDSATWTVFEQVWEAGRRPGDIAAMLKREAGWVYQAKFKVVQRLKQEISRLSEDIAWFRR